jgi:hypothetical protein
MASQNRRAGFRAGVGGQLSLIESDYISQLNKEKNEVTKNMTSDYSSPGAPGARSLTSKKKETKK